MGELSSARHPGVSGMRVRGFIQLPGKGPGAGGGQGRRHKVNQAG